MFVCNYKTYTWYLMHIKPAKSSSLTQGIEMEPSLNEDGGTIVSDLVSALWHEPGAALGPSSVSFALIPALFPLLLGVVATPTAVFGPAGLGGDTLLFKQLLADTGKVNADKTKLSISAFLYLKGHTSGFINKIL